MSGLSEQELEFARPCPRDGYYDVFISFRGIDTRNGFTDTLYHSLLGSKIYTFIDADLAGNVIETLFEIIGRSRMAVVVYSEMFASSHWCLTELELIMQRWEKKKMLMIPIFYKVDVHELKHPTEKTVKYFDQHVKKYGEAVVEKWKSVVTKIGYVSGFPYKDVYTRSERDFITTQVIVTIKKKLREWGETVQESSTSKPNNNNNSCSAATENHDVFISYLGKDTRFDLVSHLYKALMNYQKEIKIFMVDRDILKNDNIFEVIQRSKMSVIVISQNYTSSRWCLRELTKILQCNKTMDQELVPIFYEITQPDLINQAVEGKIAGHLQKHARNEKPETIQSWRNAIIDLGNMVGWRYSTTHTYSKSEELADFIQELVEEISTILNRIEDEKNESSRKQEADGDVDEKQADDEMVQKLKLDEEQVYRVVTCTYFQKTLEYMGDLLSVKPQYMMFYVEPEKENSTLLVLSNNTDDYVAFLIQCTTEPLKYRVCPSEGLVLPHSTCQVIVTMEAQSTVFSASKRMVCSEKFLVQSVIAKNDSYNSTNDFSDLFKKESESCIDKWLLKVLCVAEPKQLSSVPDYYSQLLNKGFFIGSLSVVSIDTHPTKPWLLLGLSWGYVCIWNYETRTEEKSFKVVNDNKLVVYAKFIDDKHWFVAGDTNGFVHVFDYNTSEKVKEFKAHEDGITCVAVHPTSPYVLTTSKDKLVKLWNWENDWTCIQTFEGHSHNVMQVAFNPKDSTSFATVSRDGTIKLWSFGSSIAEFTINAHTKCLYSTEYFVGNDDKLYLLSGSDDYTARVWDYESKTLVKTLEGHSHYVMKILVHPKLPIIITGSLDKTIRIWNKNTHRLELVWNCELGKIWTMGFIKTSDEVILGCRDGVIVIKIVNAGTRSD